MGRRLITEQELVATALAAHGPDGAEKFVQEGIWRTDFKGWLERRTQVWGSYVRALEVDLATMETDRRLRRDVERASIWIFTPGLPWRIGADFFYRHLLDGDAASNTLGWR